MQIDTKEIEYCKLLVNYVAEKEDIADKKAEVLKAFKNAPVKGFRKNKANMKTIEVFYRDQISESLKRALAENAYHDTVFEKKVRPYGTPKFNSLLLVGDKFTCEFELLVKPDFEICDFRAFEIPKIHQEHSLEANVQHMLQELRVRYGTVTPYTETDFVQSGDSIILDYEGSVDGAKVNEISAVGEMMTVGSSNLVDFDNNLTGLKMGETREFDLVVPENGLPQLAGQKIHFKATITMGSKNEPCPLNDELATKLGKANFEELKQAVVMSATHGMQQSDRNKLSEAVAKRLIKEIVFRVPEFLSLAEAKYLAHNSKMEWDKLSDTEKDQFVVAGEQNVRLALIFDRVRDLEPESLLNDQEIFNIIKDNLTQSGKPVEETIQEMSKSGSLQVVASRIKDEYTIDFICKNVKIVE